MVYVAALQMVTDHDFAPDDLVPLTSHQCRFIVQPSREQEGHVGYLRYCNLPPEAHMRARTMPA